MPNESPLSHKLITLCEVISRGHFERARELFELSKAKDYPADVAALAEAFGMMMVQVEAREFRLENTIEDLRMTQQKLSRTNEQLQQSLRELQQAQMQLIQQAKLESVGRLAAGVAHEVKNPLAIIQLGVDFLAPELAVNPLMRETIEDMADAVQRADQVIKGLLDFSRSENLELKPGELNRVIENSLFLVRHDLSKSRVTVHFLQAENLPLLALDANKLKQVFINLFMNASHAMPQGGSIEISTEYRILNADDTVRWTRYGAPVTTGDHVILIEIKDTGSGIPDDLHGKLFDPFFTTKPVGIGTGLGLSVSRNIIELHRGVIDIANRSDARGAIVSILFTIQEEGSA
jgi:signal transduction histidine kinase